MPPDPARLRLVLAFAAIYLIWGATFFGTVFLLRSFPPFVGAALRFIAAGIVVLCWLRWRMPRPLEGLPLARVALCGVLLLSGGNGLVVWAQQGVPSGIAALVVASLPMAVLILQRMFFGQRTPGWRTLVGILIGFLGVLLVVSQLGELSGTVRPLHVVSLLAAVFSWALGTLLHRGVPAERVLASAGVQMLVGGCVLALVALAAGEWRGLDLARVSRDSWLALAYLVVFGSIIAQASYLWLLTYVPAQKVATYALVNPIVAMALGALLLGERLNSIAGFAVALVLAGVALVLWSGREAA